jgi:hypothetical protein
MVYLITMSFIFAILNRARGSKLFDKTKSTQVARLVSTALMAGLIAGGVFQFAALWLALYFWSLFGWGKYAGAATTGFMPNEKEFAPVDWVMKRLPFALNTRMWGAVAMGLRMTLAIPAVLIAGGSWLVLSTPLIGMVYWPCGLMFPKQGWKAGEYAGGAILGAILWLAANNWG